LLLHTVAIPVAIPITIRILEYVTIQVPDSESG